MTFYSEKEVDKNLDFDWEEVFQQVALEAIDFVECPYEAQINLLLTDNEGIRTINKETRNIDKPTDVLSFPNLYYDIPSDFSLVEENEADYFDPDTGELILGDIIISVDKVFEQAESYGHSTKREFAFLVAHSMLHLFGYDHEAPEEEADMIKRQETILQNLGITRDAK